MWYDTIWYILWCDMMWYDMIWYDLIPYIATLFDMTSCMCFDMAWYVLKRYVRHQAYDMTVQFNDIWKDMNSYDAMCINDMTWYDFIWDKMVWYDMTHAMWYCRAWAWIQYALGCRCLDVFPPNARGAPKQSTSEVLQDRGASMDFSRSSILPFRSFQELGWWTRSVNQRKKMGDLIGRCGTGCD